MKSLTRAESGYVLPVLLLMLLGLTGLVWGMSRTVIASAAVQGDRRDQDAARRYAMTAQKIVVLLSQYEDTRYGSGAWRAKAAANAFNIRDSAIGYGRIQTRLVDPTGNFNDRKWETAVLYCTGIAGQASYTFSVEVAPAPSPVLMNAIFAGQTLTVSATTRLAGSGRTNSNVIGSKTLTGELYAGSSIGCPVVGESHPYYSTTTIPTVDLGWYTAVGTVIPYQGVYKDMLFSPTSNPFGAPNPYGVYIISPASGDVKFMDCRVVGTIVYPNASNLTMTMSKGFILESLSPERLGMIITGNANSTLEFSLSSYLTERDNPFLNFNPAGTPYPYENGTSDGDGFDNYQSKFDGFAWSSGKIEVRNSRLTGKGGLACAGDFTMRGYMAWDSSRQFERMIGLEGQGFRIISGTHKQIL